MVIPASIVLMRTHLLHRMFHHIVLGLIYNTRAQRLIEHICRALGTLGRIDGLSGLRKTETKLTVHALKRIALGRLILIVTRTTAVVIVGYITKFFNLTDA